MIYQLLKKNTTEFWQEAAQELLRGPGALQRYDLIENSSKL